MRGRLILAATVVVACAAPAAATSLPIPAPVAPTLLPGIGATADRLRVSILPTGASADDDESVAVSLSGDGSPQSVTVDQRIMLTGRGDYVVVERGPARQAQVLGDGDPPTLKAGAVLYAGFLPPTGRLLAAHLTLDPAYEAARLPLGVRLAFHPDGTARTAPLGQGGEVTKPGYLDVTLTAAADTIATVSRADAPASELAGPLDALRLAAAHPGERPPAAGLGLPTGIAATGPVQQSIVNAPAPLLVAGSVREIDAAGRPVDGATTSGPGTRAAGEISGVLADRTTLRLTVPRAGFVRLSLRAVPALDARALQPPAGASSWAVTHPAAVARRAAVDQLEFAAAESAQIRTISPYLTTGLPGVVHSTFSYRIDAASAAPARVVPTLVRRPFGIAMIALAAVLIAVNLELLRRRA